ncbi:DNA-binding transcriptional LysR family regulator [Oxalobacteraceae bacterium GrIS 1.11]
MYKLRDMQLIRYISEENTLAGAAERAGITPSAVTQRLLVIEKNIGAPLVFRGRKSTFGLTPIGKTLNLSATIITAEFEHFERQLRTLKENTAGHLRVMAADSLMIDDLPRVFNTILRDMPEVTITTTDGSFGIVTEGVLSGEIDVGLLPFSPPTPGLETTLYKVDRICLIVPHGHPLAQRQKAIFFRDVLLYDFVGLDNTKRMSSFLDGKARGEGSTMHCRIRFSNLEAQAATVAKIPLSIGVTFESIARRAAKSQPIKIIHLEDNWAMQEFHLLTRNFADMSAAGQYFVTLMTKRRTHA